MMLPFLSTGGRCFCGGHLWDDWFGGSVLSSGFRCSCSVTEFDLGILFHDSELKLTISQINILL